MRRKHDAGALGHYNFTGKPVLFFTRLYSNHNNFSNHYNNSRSTTSSVILNAYDKGLLYARIY